MALRRLEKPPTLDPDATYDDLLTKAKEIMHREVRHLAQESAKGKLSNASSNNLVAYIKVLQELSEREEEMLKEMTEEQLLAVVKAANESKSEGRRAGLAEKAEEEGSGD